MYPYSSGDIIGGICLIFFFIVIVLCCCLGNDDKSGKAPSKKVTSPKLPRTVTYHDDDSYCECPSCGAPYYDGYCEECGYPDVNQGWLGENY